MNINDAIQVIKETISSSLSQDTLTVWEKASTGYKYVIVFNNYVLSPGTEPLLFNKLILLANEDKTEIIKQGSSYKLYYQYDLPCVFRSLSFNNNEELKDAILSVLSCNNETAFAIFNKEFNNMTVQVNDMIKNDVTDSISTIVPVPSEIIIPCKEYKFNFVCNILSSNKEINISLTPSSNTTKWEVKCILDSNEKTLLANDVKDITTAISSCIINLINKK